MSNLVMVLGKSGSGKSTSLRNFAPDEVGVFSVAGKRLPFKGDLPVVQHADYKRIADVIAANRRRAYVIDDATYLMQFDNFARAKETGYGKFTDMALNFERVIEWSTQTNADTIVYIMMHVDRDANGHMKPKTIGKMLEEKFCIEGACPIVIQSTIVDGKHVFVTKGDGLNGAKAPMDMLPDVMDNDLAEVDRLIREYWQMKPLTDKKGK